MQLGDAIKPHSYTLENPIGKDMLVKNFFTGVEDDSKNYDHFYVRKYNYYSMPLLVKRL